MTSRYKPKRVAEHIAHGGAGRNVTAQNQAIPRAQNRVVSSVHLKPTDITLSRSLEKKFPEKIKLFDKLKSKERKLDLMINKKLLDIQDYQQSIAGGFTLEDTKDTDILRIFIYNTSKNQPWQIAQQKEQAKSLVEGESVEKSTKDPSWTLRIEGRLLNEKEPASSLKRKKFSTFLSSISVELRAKDGNDKDLSIKAVPSGGNKGTDARIIEWHDDPAIPEAERVKKQFDGLDICRGGLSIPQSEVPDGDSIDPSEREIVANIVIQPKMYPIRLQVMNEQLVELLGSSEITQTECVHRLFNYAKVNNLFEVENSQKTQPSQQQQRTQNGDDADISSQNKVVTIKADDLLYNIFGQNRLTLSRMMELLSTRLLKPIKPIRLQYSINTLRNTTLGDVVIDLKVNTKLTDPKIKPGASILASINKLLSEHVMNKKTIEEMARLNEGLRLNIQALNYSKMKYDFYKKLSEDPVRFLKKNLKRNEEYLKILSSDSVSFGANGMVDEEIVRRSDFYTDEFLKQHINILLNGGRI